MEFDNFIVRVRNATIDYFTRRPSEFEEAARVLKDLSKHLSHLEYLDLEGCFGWLTALSWKTRGAIRPRAHLEEPEYLRWASDNHQTTWCPPFESPLNDYWVKVAFINVQQSTWIPTDVEAIDRQQRLDIRSELLDYAKAMGVHIPGIIPTPLKEKPVSQSEYDVTKWVEREIQIRFLVARIRQLKLASSHPSQIVFDHGLNPPVSQEEDPAGFTEDFEERKCNEQAPLRLSLLRPSAPDFVPSSSRNPRRFLMSGVSDMFR